MTPHRELLIRKLQDYVRLNGLALSRSGFHSGRAGVALCLFESARFLQDEKLEEEAMTFLRQSLVTRIEDITFENGLSGIGYVLDYLIRYGFLEADYEELFGMQTQRIFDEFCDLTEGKHKVEAAFPYIPVVRLIARRGAEKDKSVACRLLDRCFADMDVQWREVATLTSGLSPDKLMNRWRSLLAVAVSLKEYVPKEDFLHAFIECYEHRRLKYDRCVFHYLHYLSERMLECGLHGFLCKYYCPVSSVREVDVLMNLHDETVLIALERKNIQLAGRFLARYLDAVPDEIEENVWNVTPDNEWKVGMGYGVARLLFTTVMLLSSPADRHRMEPLLWM